MLSHLVTRLQAAVQRKMLDSACITSAIGELTALGFRQYDTDKFPQLPIDTHRFDTNVGDAPQTLAEALLWKLGKWTAYKAFVKNFSNDELEVSSAGGVVFSAFARHLQDQSRPVYDQHAIRALWAICRLSDEERKRCTSLLFDGGGKWKDSGSGDDGFCYELFVQHVAILCEDNGIGHAELDKLLMPLGQAIKKSTKERANGLRGSDKSRFIALCWPERATMS
jgi:hypothetical protein